MDMENSLNNITYKKPICQIHSDVLKALTIVGDRKKQKHAMKNLLDVLDYLIVKKKFTLEDIERDLSISRNTFYFYSSIFKQLKLSKITVDRETNKKVFVYRKSPYLAIFLFFIFSELRCPKTYSKIAGEKIIAKLKEQLDKYKNITDAMSKL